jgi:TolB-like protein/Flp pilus assembly protein TadD/tRNA A-37 threonylcarbamoyl transferase component Bud32
MQLLGLTDSPAGVTKMPAKCRVCGATTRLANGLCLSCTLREALDEDCEGSRESFEAALAQSEVKDTHWRVDSYEVLEEIGRGGMGVIYRARQRHSRRIVALKRMVSYHADSRETRERFRREAEAAASLDHPNILPIYEVGQGEDGLPFFSMKYAAGGSLQKAAPALRREQRECVRLMAKVARAVQYAHEHGIVHRDLKPGNILLDAHGEPFVTDFGLAKWLDTNTDLTRTLAIFGTPGYIAPEQARGATTPTADVYSLGAILFNLFTGRSPFLGEHALAMIEQASEKPAPKLRSLVPSLDRDLETIVARCLERDPKVRYQSAGVLADDLEHWLRHEPIRARRVGILARGGKWVRRNPTTTVLIAALVVLAAAIVGVMVWKNESPHPVPSLPAGIAVLPLQNLSEEKENAYFADGIQDELLTNLSKIRDLKVISRTSVMQYKSGITRNLKEIAQQLGVSNVVEGSVRRSANHVRVSVQLIDAKTNRHLWAQNYDRTLTDSVALQGNLATEIAAALGATLSPQEKAHVQAKPTKNTAAYDAYLRGRAFAARSYQKSYEDNAIQSYQEAVRLDPDFALAWARLSIAVGHNGWDPSPAQLAAVKDAADHALTLDPDLPETHLAVGYYRYGQRDYLGALSEFQQAEQGLPNNAEVIEAIALIQRRLGRWEEAITGLRRTIELDPRYHDAYENLAGTYRWLRRFPETLATVDQLLAWEPNDLIALGRKASALWAMGDLQAVEPLLTNPGFDSYDRGVHALFQRRYATATEIFSAPPPSNLAPHPGTSERQLFLGLSQQRAGDIPAAHATYQKAAQDFQSELEKVVPGSWQEAWLRTCLGRAYAGLGEGASAIAEGEKAIAIDPASKNPVDGPVWEEKMANIYALLGDADHAIPILKRLLQTTYAGAITPALLRLDPIWDEIRNDPRFQELAAEGKPILEKSIAVLPFENLSADPENAFFADGVQDEILNDLAKIADLKVISRTSVMQYKSGTKRNLRQIANELGVTHVVEGSVQRAANRVRVTAQLIDAKTDTHLWRESYDRPLDNIFAIQSDIAQAIVKQLQPKLSPKQKAAIEERPTSDLVAYDLYLKAKELMYNARFNPARREKALFKAVQLLDEAVTRDPVFLLAHCQLAYANDQIYFSDYDHTETRLALAQSSVEAAVRIQPDSGEAHLAQANHFFWGYLNYDRAREELVKAQRELPNNTEVFRTFGHMNRWEGRLEEARQNLGRAVELDPRNTRTLTDLGFVYWALRKYEEADDIVTRLQALEPRSPILRTGREWVGLEARADTASLRAVVNTVESESSQSATEVSDLSFRLALYERDPAAAARALANMPREGKIDMNYAPFPHTWYEGLLATLRQDEAAAHSAFSSARAETEKLVRAQPANVKPLAVLALIDAQLGEKEKAIREGRTTCDMLPHTKNAIDGIWLMTNLARIYAVTGENDLALEQLEVLSKLPSAWFGFSYGDLRLSREWDPLRGDPRFEKIVEEAKKPVAFESPPPLPSGIAVLPFENLSVDPENAFFADGVQDEILNNLAKIADLKVISRTSVLQYKSGGKRNLRQIANELGVAHVVEGNVQRTDNRVRVSAQLIDAKDDTHLWAESYDRPLGDVFAIQSEIAKAIAGQLKAKLSATEKTAIEQPPTTNLIAYNRYSRARKLGARQTGRVPGEAREVIRLLEQAVAYDPTFMLAYCELARAHDYAYHLGVDRTPARVALAKAARDAALRLAPDRAEPHLAAASVAFHCDLDYETALSEVAIAREKLPNDASVFALPAYIHRRQGHWENCAKDLERAVQLDPRNVWLLQDTAQTYQFLRRFPEAAAAWDRTLAVAPGDPNTRVYRALVDMDSHADMQPIQDVIEKIISEDPSAVDAISEHWLYLTLCRRDPAEMERALASLPPEGIVRRDLIMPRSFCEGLVARTRGDATLAETAFSASRAEMEKVVREQPDYAQALCVLGISDAALGHKEDAIREGRRAAELLPVTKDMMAGGVVLANLAIIYAWTEETDLALEQLATAIRFPSSNFLSYGQLKLHPFWDPLRGDPRFEKLVEESKKPIAVNKL